MYRARASTITVLCAYTVFVVAGFGFQKMPDDAGIAAAASAHPVIDLAFGLTAAGSLVAALAVVAGGLPLAIAALRSARVTRRRDIPLLFAVPPLALATFLGVTILLERLTPGSSRAALFFVGAFILAAMGSAASVSAAIVRSDLGARPLTDARVPVVLVALAMGVMLTSTVVWGLSLRIYAPRLFAEMDATGTYGVFTWDRVVTLMALATLVAIVGIGRGVAPRQDTRVRV